MRCSVSASQGMSSKTCNEQEGVGQGLSNTPSSSRQPGEIAWWQLTRASFWMCARYAARSRGFTAVPVLLQSCDRVGNAALRCW